MSNMKAISNNFFQFNRVVKLARRDIKSYTKKELLLVSVIAAIPLLFLLINLLFRYEVVGVGSRTKLLLNILLFIFAFSPYLFFYRVNHLSKGLTEVMLPASIFEKFIYMQLVVLIFAPLGALLLYGVVDGVLSMVASPLFKGSALWGAYGFFKEASWTDFTSLLILQQLIFLSNLSFRSKKFIKLFGVIIVIQIGLALVAVVISKLFPMEMWEQLSHWIERVSFKTLYYLMPLGLAVWSYFKMKSLKF